MFDIGFSELVLIGLIALIVLGPKRLPEAARAAGRWMGQLRRFVASVKQDLDRELRADELAELRRLKDELDDTRRALSESSSQIVQGLTETAEAASIRPPAAALPEPPAAAGTPKPPRRRKKPVRPHGRRRTKARKRR
jgi:sec-independent protein translocase protein TatB